MKEQRFRKLEVWERSMGFITTVYKYTAAFPNHELYGLSAQLRKAATSIALNIAEGSAAGSDAEFNRFLNIALRSSYEVVCGIEIAGNLNYCSNDIKNNLLSEADEISAMLTGLKKSLKKS